MQNKKANYFTQFIYFLFSFFLFEIGINYDHDPENKIRILKWRHNDFVSERNERKNCIASQTNFGMFTPPAKCMSHKAAKEYW